MLVAGAPPQSTRSSARRSVLAQDIREDGSESDELNEDIPKPRLSLPLDEEDDSFHAPPRPSLPLEDDTNTQMSIEAPRRAVPKDDLTRLSRTSMRISDRFGDIEGLEDEEFRIEVPFDQQAPLDGGDTPQESFLEESTE